MAIRIAGDDRDHNIYFRDIIECVRMIWRNPNLSDKMVFRPQRVFNNSGKESRLYNEMWTGDWWWQIQDQLPIGATVAPLIVASDKTMLTQYRGGKSAYPVYLTIGNLPKRVRRQGSEHSVVLLAYLSTTKLAESNLTKAQWRTHMHRLFHEAMYKIFEPLRAIGRVGVEMASADGTIRSVHPILAVYPADYPEQCLVCLAKQGSCPVCCRDKDSLAEAGTSAARTPQQTLDIIRNALYDRSRTSFEALCKVALVDGFVVTPFWEGLPFTNIYSAIVPDPLHQLHQGIFKHVLEWSQAIIGTSELDERLKRLPLSYGVRYFEKGWSSMSQITGPERKDMERIFLGVLSSTSAPKSVIRAVAALLDFIYTAQHTSHNTESLKELGNALTRWHANKAGFIAAGVRNDFDIPKFHMMEHYISSIKLFGTTDNYSTELFERLHIEYAKNAWAASNQRDALRQMITWLDRREKIGQFNTQMVWRQGLHGHNLKLSPVDATCHRGEHLLSFCGADLCIAKRPSLRLQVAAIQLKHGIPGFGLDLYNFVLENCSVGLHRRLQVDVGMKNSLVSERLDVWHRVKLSHPDFRRLDDEAKTQDVIYTRPGRFDIALIQTYFGPDAEKSSLRHSRVAQVRAIFLLSERLRRIDPGLPSEPLAYVFWWQAPGNIPDPSSGLYTVRRAAAKGHGRACGVPSTAVIPLSRIRHSLHLIPKFDCKLPLRGVKCGPQSKWTSSDILEECNVFFINNFVNQDIYLRVF